MKINQSLYYCTECKRVVDDVDSLLFVEENTTKSFCSEECIENFFRPLTKHYQSLEKSLRQKYGIEIEAIETNKDDEILMEMASKSAHEIWICPNQLGEEVYSFIYHHRDFSIVILCTVFNYSPSYVYLFTKTKHKDFLEHFRIGTMIENPQHFLHDSKKEDEKAQQEFITLLEAKKSSFLAMLLEMQNPNDIQIDQFHMYEKYFEGTLNFPDEVYLTEDKEHDEVLVYIKSHEVQHHSFFYYAICLRMPRHENNENEEGVYSMFPILAFPSVDPEINRFFRQGTLVAGHLRS